MTRQYITYRSLPVWPHKPTQQRQNARFDTPWGRTLNLLFNEVEKLGGSEITFGVGLTEADIRQDGQPRANARARSHPGIEISFDTTSFGRQTYATDLYFDWQDNVRAVALSLEALRAVERWGVSKGRQYTGFALLQAGPGLEDLGRRHVERWGSIKEALRHVHPDTGDTDMTPHDYEAVIAFRKAEKTAGR